MNHGVIRYLYHYGTRFAAGRFSKDSTGPGEPLWEHAEEFLDYLDTAALNEEVPTAWVLRKIVLERLSEAKANDVRMSDPRAAARRVVAAQCTTFAVNGEPESERWRPFVAWAKALGPGDTIVTFNYDPVLERLHESTSKFDFPNSGIKGKSLGGPRPGLQASWERQLEAQSCANQGPTGPGIRHKMPR